MNQTQKLLQSVVENARVGLDACEQLLQFAKEPEIRQELMHEREQYQTFQRDAEQSLYDAGARPHAQNPLSRAGMWVGLRVNTLTDDSASHLADIIIQGATMGVIGMTRDRNDLPDADAHAHDIASQFITAQQESIERLKNLL